MKKILLAAAGASVLLCAASSMPLQLSGIAGVYKTQHHINVVMGTGEPDEDVAVEDILEIVPTDSSHAYLRTHLVFENGHICGVWGIATLEDGALVYRPHDNVEGPCTLRLTQEGSQIVFHDADGACKIDYCGARGTLDGPAFPLSARRPIRYMKRLLASPQYSQATAEQDAHK